jgi:hypothetical protein
MTTPTRYSLSYDFTAWQAANPTLPLPADKIKIEFNNLDTTTDQIIDNLALIQASDGGLKAGIVDVASLATELTIGLAAPSAWASSTVYAVNDTVIESNKLYRCLVAHTATSFAANLASSYWLEVADYAAFIVSAEAAKDAAEAAQAAAEAAQTATETAYDNFDDRYLGSKTSDPTLDNDGNALVTGALYWNSSNNEMRAYTGTSWVAATGSTTLPIFVYTAAGGETSVSGADDNANVLSYTPTKIIVFINGVNETQNVTATTGTSITGITALSASDVVEIYAFTSVAAIEDIISHSTATPVLTDFVLFSDVSDGNSDRRATVAGLVLTDGIIASATSATITATDTVLFGDTSDSNNTKKATVQEIINLVPDTSLMNTDITGQTAATVAVGDTFIFTDADDSDILKKSTVQGIIDISHDIASLTAVTPVSDDIVMIGDVSDSSNPKQATIAQLINTAGISQSGLNTSTGTFSGATGAIVPSSPDSATVVSGGTEITLPGGTYGFFPQSRSCIMSSDEVAFFAILGTGGTYATKVSAISIRDAIELGQAATTISGQQRYVAASPPFDMGDGEVGGFFFVVLNEKGEVVSHYTADVPPWAYNGPTDIRPDRICDKTGKKFKNVVCDLTFEEAMDGAQINIVEKEITHNMKNADMGLLPQPFGNLPKGHTVVLLDPMSDQIRRLVDYQNAGGHEDIYDLIGSGRLKVDNENLVRKGPVNIAQVKFEIGKKRK